MQFECKNYHNYRKDYSWNPGKCFCENGKYSKSVADHSTIVCDDFIFVMYIVPTDGLTNSDEKKVKYKMDFHILYTVLLVIILLFIIVVICYHYAQYTSKLKKAYYRTKNTKLINNQF